MKAMATISLGLKSPEMAVILLTNDFDLVKK